MNHFLYKAIQECNSHAVTVWNRVNQKLEGKDPDADKTLSIQEQANKLDNKYFKIIFFYSQILNKGRLHH